ncbi:MAG: Crp/Fnr family transcriptional regulator [Cyanobacteria bacterium J06621_11]
MPVSPKPVSIDCLAQLSILQDFKQDQLLSLGASAQLYSYKSDEIVFCEHDILPASLYILSSGSLHITRTARTGKEALFRTLQAGDIFAAPALVGDCIAPATVRASVPSEVVTIDRSAVVAAIGQSPAIALRILSVYNQRLQQMHNSLYGMVCERAIVRLIKLIKQQALEYGVEQTQAGHDCLKQNLPYGQIAGRIGISYEECVRLSHRLKPMLTYKRGGKICVSDWLALDKLCL